MGWVTLDGVGVELVELSFSCRDCQAISIFWFSLLVNGLQATGVGSEAPTTTRETVEVVVLALVVLLGVVVLPAGLDWVLRFWPLLDVVIGFEMREPSELKSDRAGPVWKNWDTRNGLELLLTMPPLLSMSVRLCESKRHNVRSFGR